MNTIGEKIRYLRKKNNITQSELAKRVGYNSDTTIAKIEKNLIELNQSKISAFAKALNTNEGYLMGWTNSITPTFETNTKNENSSILSIEQQECFDLIKKLNKSQCRATKYYLLALLNKEQ